MVWSRGVDFIVQQWEYHSRMATDVPTLDRVEEAIREHVYRRYNQELPVSCNDV